MPEATSDRHDLTWADGSVTPGRRLNNWTATVPPGSTDDEDKHYEVGSRWVVQSTGVVYTCTKATAGAAVWSVGGSGGGGTSDHGALTGLLDDDHTQYAILVDDTTAPPADRPGWLWYDPDDPSGGTGGGGGGAPTGAAGGELGGSYPDPTVDASHSGSTHAATGAAAQAAAEATAAAALIGHTGDTSDAHDASAISVLDAGGLLTATDVEAALAELATGIGGGGGPSGDHLHEASEVSYDNAGGLYTTTPVIVAYRPDATGPLSGSIGWTNSGSQALHQQIDEPVNNRADYVDVDVDSGFVVWVPAWSGLDTDVITRCRLRADIENGSAGTIEGYLRRKVEGDSSSALFSLPLFHDGVASSSYLTVNPFTGVAWTHADIENTGLRIARGGGGGPKKVFQVWLEVEYTTGVTVQYAVTKTQTDLDTHEASPHGGGGGGTATATVGAMLRNTTTQALSAGVSTSLTFNSVDRDTDGFWSAGNPTRATVPAGLGGWYLVTGYMRPNASSGLLLMFLRINGDDNNIVDVFDQTAVNEGRYKNVWLVFLNAGDYVELRGYVVGGSTSGHATSVHLQNQMRLVKVGGGVVAGLPSARSKRTAGSYTLNSTTWANVDTGLDYVVPAQVGDVLLVQVSGLWGGEAVNGYLDAATIVGGSPVNHVGGTGGATERGVAGWEGEASAVTPIGGGIQYVVQAGDISGGNVTLRLRYRTSAAANRTLFGTGDIPLVWSVVNLKGGAAVQSGLIAYKRYAPATQEIKSTTSGTFADADATNLVVTFVAPPSGAVLIRLGAHQDISPTGGFHQWNLRSGSSDVAGSSVQAGRESEGVFTSVPIILTGLTPGTSYTYKWGYRTSAGTARLLMGDASPTNETGPAVMEVWVAP